jgi:hypothetical protein
VLVSLISQVVNTIDITPPMIGWKLSHWDLWELILDEWLEILIMNV